MTHLQAYELAVQHASQKLGTLWNTALRKRCDLAWAVADYYDADETAAAVDALKQLSEGVIPDGWEPA